MHSLDATYSHSVVCLSVCVCLLARIASPAKPAEPIKMLFYNVDLSAPKEPLLDGGAY